MARGRRAAKGVAPWGASALLHLGALAALLWLSGRPSPPVPMPAGMAVSLVWDSQREGAGDAEDSAAAAPDAPPAPAAPPVVAALPPPTPADPPAPPPGPPPPPAPAPPLAAIVPALPAPPLPPAPAEVAALPMPAALPPRPPAEAMPTPPEPRQQQQAAATPRPPAPRPAVPPAQTQPPAQAAPAPTLWSPPLRLGPPAEADGAPLAAGAGTATGRVVPARPGAGAANQPPAYPDSSRRRGEEGRVTLLVQVDDKGRVLNLSVLTSSGYPALDREAERAVRRWRFEPGTQDGRPVFSTVPVAITFRLEAGGLW